MFEPKSLCNHTSVKDEKILFNLLKFITIYDII